MIIMIIIKNIEKNINNKKKIMMKNTEKKINKN